MSFERRNRKSQKKSGLELLEELSNQQASSTMNSPSFNIPDNSTQRTGSQPISPQQSTQNTQIPMQNQPQNYNWPKDEQLLERLAYLEARNKKLKSELAFHNKKLEVLEKQMMVFFQKLDKYEQAQSPNSNGLYIPTQPNMIEVQNEPSGTNKWQFQSI